MGLNQAVGAEPADEERARQHPEVALRVEFEQDLESPTERRRRRDMGRRVAFVAIGLQADVLWLVDEKENDEERGEQEGDDRRGERDPPAVALGEPRRQRARSRSWPDALEALRIPTARPRRAVNQRAATSAPEHHGGQAGAKADNDAPEKHKLPKLGHHKRADEPDLDQRQGDQHHALEAVFVDQRSRERRHQAEEHDPKRERDRYLLGAPAEFLGQRHYQRAGDAHAAGGGQGEEKNDCDDRPAVVDAGARKPPRQGLSEHAGSLQRATRPAPIVKKTG